MILHVDVSFLFERVRVAYLNPQAKVGCQVLQRHSLALLDEVHKGPQHALCTHTHTHAQHGIIILWPGLHVHVANSAHIAHHVKALTSMIAATTAKPHYSIRLWFICTYRSLSGTSCTDLPVLFITE